MASPPVASRAAGHDIEEIDGVVVARGGEQCAIRAE
jgi:hypothetical protein